MSLNETIERLYQLKRGKRGGHERPHKPALLLAVLDLVESGVIRDNRIELTDDLVRVFKEIFGKVARRDDRPSIENPFYYLCGDGFWHLESAQGETSLYVSGDVRAPKSIGQLRRQADFAYFDPDFWKLIKHRETRAEIQSALIARFFPDHADNLTGRNAAYDERHEGTDPTVHESPARSNAFRRFVCELYDHQCAACGLRIRLNNELSFVDAAHLIPFSASHNDHPSNGIALCKNHHWAMDQSLIALNLNDTWRVAPILNPRRSPAEKDLSDLDGHRIIRLPDETDFRPATSGREWRLQRLLRA